MTYLTLKNNEMLAGLSDPPAGAVVQPVQGSAGFWAGLGPFLTSEAFYWRQTPAGQDDWSGQVCGGSEVWRCVQTGKGKPPGIDLP